MSILGHFSLPYAGLKDGVHGYSFEAGPDFFEEFENAPIKEGSFIINLDVDKRPGLSELKFDIKGHVSAVCDRCLADIRLPVAGKYDLLVKVSSTGTDDDDVMYLKEDQSHLFLGQIIYEFICLSLPLIYKYDCEKEIPKPCNEEVLAKLNTSDSGEESNQTLNIWNDLNGIQLDN